MMARNIQNVASGRCRTKQTIFENLYLEAGGHGRSPGGYKGAFTAAKGLAQWLDSGLLTTSL